MLELHNIISPMTRRIAMFLILIFSANGFPQVLTEFYQFGNFQIIVKLDIHNPEKGKEISEKVFCLITNEIFNYSYEEGSYLKNLTERAYKRFVPITEDLRTILGRILYYHSLTRSISPMLGYLVDLWGFEKRRFYVPSHLEISNALKISSLKNIVISDGKIMLKNKQTKFYLVPFSIGVALTKVRSFLKNHNVSSAFVSVGNNFSLCIGSKEREGWLIGVSNPRSRERNETIFTINVSNSSVCTTDVAENSFVEGFKTYHSVLDPKTGYPADTGTLSVTVVHDDPLEAVILSRLLLVLGKDAGILFAEKRKIKASFITLEDNRTRIYKTSTWIKSFDKDTTKKVN